MLDLFPFRKNHQAKAAGFPAGWPTLNGNGKHTRLNVCMLAACPFPANHGTPGSIREMAEAIAELGHEVHVVTYHIGEEIPLQGLHVHRIPPLTRESTVTVGPTVRRPLYDLQMVFKTLQVIRAHHPHVLHAHGYEAALVAWFCRMFTGIPIVYSGHNTMADELPTYRFIRPPWLARALAAALDAWVPRIGDLCLPHSRNIEQFLQRKGLGLRTEPVVNFGIRVDDMVGGDGAAVRRRHALGTAPVAVYAGVLDQFQRIDLLLEAVAHALQQEPELKLLIVVTIPHAGHQAAVREKATQLGIADRVILTDPQPLPAVRDYLAAAEVAVVPRPAAPGFPIKLLNYMAAAKPCVLFASSASNGLEHGDNVLLASPDSSAALGQAIVEVLQDHDLAARIAQNGHAFVRAHHDRLRVARKVCQAYERVLAGAGGRSDDTIVAARQPANCAVHS